MPFSLRQRTLARSRPPLTEEQFRDLIIKAVGDPSAASMIWGHLQEWICVPGFSPYPDDPLCDVYGIAEEELDEDLIWRLLVSFDIAPPPQDAMQAFGPIDTPARAACFVAMCRSAAG